MRRSWIVLVTAALILSLGTIGAVSIASAAPRNQPDITTAQTFTVLAHATNFKAINVDGSDPNGPGDYAVERWALRASGTPAGRLNDQCTINFSQGPSNPTALCLFAFTSPARARSPAMARWCSPPHQRAFDRFPSTFPSPAAQGATRTPAVRFTSSPERGRRQVHLPPDPIAAPSREISSRWHRNSGRMVVPILTGLSSACPS
jgi:hypothetical protein